MPFLASLRGGIVEVPILAGWIRYLFAALCHRIIGESLGAVESTSTAPFQRNVSVETLTLISSIHKHVLTTLRHNYDQVTYVAILIVLISGWAGHDDLVALVSCGIVSGVRWAVRLNQVT